MLGVGKQDCGFLILNSALPAAAWLPGGVPTAGDQSCPERFLLVATMHPPRRHLRFLTGAWDPSPHHCSPQPRLTWSSVLSTHLPHWRKQSIPRWKDRWTGGCPAKATFCPLPLPARSTPPRHTRLGLGLAGTFWSVSASLCLSTCVSVTTAVERRRKIDYRDRADVEETLPRRSGRPRDKVGCIAAAPGSAGNRAWAGRPSLRWAPRKDGWR